MCFVIFAWRSNSIAVDGFSWFVFKWFSVVFVYFVLSFVGFFVVFLLSFVCYCSCVLSSFPCCTLFILYSLFVLSEGILCLVVFSDVLCFLDLLWKLQPLQFSPGSSDLQEARHFLCKMKHGLAEDVSFFASEFLKSSQKAPKTQGENTSFNSTKSSKGENP